MQKRTDSFNTFKGLKVLKNTKHNCQEHTELLRWTHLTLVFFCCHSAFTLLTLGASGTIKIYENDKIFIARLYFELPMLIE